MMMPGRTLKEQTAKGLFWGGLSNGIQQILNLVFGLVLARILNASDYGLVGMLAIFSAVVTTIQDSGFTTALINQKEIRHEDYNAVFWFSSLTGILFYIILFFCAPLIAHFYEKPELIKLSRIIFLSIIFSGLSLASNAYIFKTLMTKEKAIIDIISLIISGGIGIFLAKNGFSYLGLAIQTTLYVTVGSMLRICYVPWSPTLKLNFAPLKNMFGFSSKLILTNIFVQINNNVFSVILGKFYNEKQLGFYSQGQKWMLMGNQLIGGMISNVVQPVLIQVVDDKERQVNVFRKMVRFGAFISFPAMFGLAFIAKEFIFIFLGEKWMGSVLFLQLFCIWGAFSFLWSLYTNILITHGKSDIYLSGMIFTGIFQLCIIFAMSPLGIILMVIGYVISNMFGLFFWHYLCSQFIIIKKTHVLKDMLPYFLSICMALLVANLVVLFVENIVVVLILKIVISAIVYILIMRLGDSIILKESINFILKRGKQ